MEPSELFRAYANVRAHMLVTRILILGFVWILWGPAASILTFGVWAFAQHSLANTFHEDLMERFRVTVMVMEPGSPDAEEARESHEEDQSG